MNTNGKKKAPGAEVTVLTLEDLCGKTTTELMNIIHAGATSVLQFDVNDVWKVLLDRKPFWWFEQSRTELVKHNDAHTEYHKRMEEELNDRISMLESAMALMTKMLSGAEVKTDFGTVMALAGLEGLCP